MKHLIAGLALAFAMAGCGGSQKKATAPAATCADAAANTKALYMASPDADATAGDIISTTITERCSTDGWSADAISCMATATQETAAACPDKLSAEQKQSFGDAMAHGMGGGGDAPPANEFANPCGE